MFERFTPAAKHVVVDAQAQRRAASDRRLRTEHLLLALLADPGPAGDALRQQGIQAEQILPPSDEGDTAAGRPPIEGDDDLLRELGIDVAAVRRSVDETLGPGALDRVRAGRSGAGGPAQSDQANDTGRSGRFDSASKRVLELTLRESLRLKTKHIGPEHIGLGLLGANDSTAFRLLVTAGVDVSALRASWETIARQTHGSSRSLVQRLRSGSRSRSGR